MFGNAKGISDIASRGISDIASRGAEFRLQLHNSHANQHHKKVFHKRTDHTS
jgi:hypothetical protein